MAGKGLSCYRGLSTLKEKLVLFREKVAMALESILECKRVGVLVIGTEVPHAHVHLIPFTSERQMAITNGKVEVPAEEMQRIASLANEKYNSLWNS